MVTQVGSSDHIPSPLSAGLPFLDHSSSEKFKVLFVHHQPSILPLQLHFRHLTHDSSYSTLGLSAQAFQTFKRRPPTDRPCLTNQIWCSKPLPNHSALGINLDVTNPLWIDESSNLDIRTLLLDFFGTSSRQIRWISPILLSGIRLLPTELRCLKCNSRPSISLFPSQFFSAPCHDERRLMSTTPAFQPSSVVAFAGFESERKVILHSSG